MESSAVNHLQQQQQQPGAQNEPFFDLLQQSAPMTTATTTTGGFPSAAYNVPKKVEAPSDFQFGGGGGDDVLPSFDFQPIRTSAAPYPSANAGGGGQAAAAARIEETRGRQGSPPSSFTSYEPMVRRSREPPPTYEVPFSKPQEHEKESIDSATAVAVERTMKKYADDLLRVLEGLTGRLCQLESSTQRLESLFEEIKDAVAHSHGEADGKLRSLESHVLEVQRGVQLLRDRQEIFEAQSQLAKFQFSSKAESTPPSVPSASPQVAEAPSQLGRASSGKALLEAPPQVSDAPSPLYYQTQPQLQLSLVNPSQQPQQAPPQLPQQQQLPPLPQHPQQQQQQAHHAQQQQLQQQQCILPSEGTPQPLQPPLPPPPSQHLSHPPPPPHPPHTPAGYTQQQQQQPLSYGQQHQPPPQPPMSNYVPPPEGPQYGQHPHPSSHHAPLPPPSYPSDLPPYQSAYGPPRPGMPPPPQQQQQQQQQPQQQQPHMPPSLQVQQPHNVGMYDAPLGRGGSGHMTLPAQYAPQSHPVPVPHHYDSQGLNPGSGYPAASYRVAQPAPSAPSGGSGGYPRLPVAKPVPQAVPSSGGSSGPSSSGSPSMSNRVPIDEVIDKVTAMGFSKDQVRAVVRRLTENGQSVDLNIVLDKLMNGEGPQAPNKGWLFGR